MLSRDQSPAYVSVVDPPGVEPVLSFSVPTIHGGQPNGSITLDTARELIKELQASLAAAERIHRGRA